jgi:hypothetical protein
MSIALYNRFGLPDAKYLKKWCVLWDVPQDIQDALPVIPRRLYLNKLLIEPLDNSLRNLIIRGKTKELKTWDGLYNNRPIRGYERRYEAATDPAVKAKYLSTHAWGLAIDVNAAWNRLGQEPALSAAFVKCFTDSGFVWGGTFKRKDGMHFELDAKYV